jgi:NAD(P)-dependent dehydrogenase (short-subunit alcohol dehydrogenase family)
MDLTMFSLEGKSAVVTGGNGGIGLAMARGLVKAGANVAIWGRNPEKNIQAVAELSAYGPAVISIQTDVGDEASIKAALAETLKAFGSIEVAVANAGISGVGDFPSDFPTEEWERVMDVNVTGVFVTLREIADAMVKSETHGSLILTGSIGGVLGMAQAPHYAASKAAVLHMTRALALKVGRHKIRVNAIAPGFIRTDMTGDWQENEKFEQTMIRSRTPLRRWGTPEDFEGPTVLLASDASSFMTGTTIFVDGGFTSG